MATTLAPPVSTAPIHKLSAYLWTVFAGAAGLLLLVTLFNALVDPFGMFRFVDIAGFNRVKPAIYNRVRLLKAYEVRRVRPTSVMLGSSRSHLGFRPSHPGWRRSTERPYNLAFDGGTTKEMYYFLLHAHAAGPVTQVLLGLDAYHPTSAPGSTRPGFDPSYLMRSRSVFSHLRLLLADLKLLTGWDTTMESIATLRRQNHPEPLWFAPDGQRLGEVFFRQVEQDYIHRGPRGYFDQVDQMEVGWKLEWRIPAPAAPGPRAPADRPDPITSIGYVGKIVEFCRREHIDLRIFFTPAHAHQEELAADVGDPDMFANSKRAMVELLKRDQAAHSNEAPIPLYDFGGYNSVTTESLPPEGSRTELNGYWDSSHFKQEVGDWVLDRVLGTETASPPVPADFGQLLTAGTVEAEIADQEQKREAYHRSHPEEVRQLQRWVETFKREHGISD